MISLLIALLIVGAVLYLLQFVPLDPTIKRIMYVVVIVAVCIWLLQHLGALGVLR